MAKLKAVLFHHRHYRYVRMMLRRYPKMREGRFGWSSNSGVVAICGGEAVRRDRIMTAALSFIKHD